MIESSPYAVSADPYTVNIRVLAIDHSGHGIKKLRVTDRLGVHIREESYESCPPEVDLDVGPVLRARFPISVTATNCIDEISTGPSFFISPHAGDDPSIPVPCDPTYCPADPVCQRAAADARLARNRVIEQCNEVAAIRQRRDSLAAAAAAAFALGAALIGAAAAVAGIPFFGQTLAAAFILVAAVALGAAIGISIQVAKEHRRLQAANRDLQAARRRFTEAADRAGRSCCPTCITVDLTQPDCA